MWRYAVKMCLGMGVKRAPRGIPVYEIPYPVTLTLENVHRPFLMSKVRRANYRFGLAEAAWILAGSEDAQLIGSFNKVMLNFSDDGRTLWGAYGPRLMGQLGHVIETLKRDPHSRQAVVTTWRPQVPPTTFYDPESFDASGVCTTVNEHNRLSDKPHLWDGASHRSKDIPCTVAWHFQLRDDVLDLTVFMRSHDVWLGMPYDVLSFTTVQRVVASVLGVEPGRYNHVLSNLHLYESNEEAARQVANKCDLVMPGIPSFGQVFRAYGPNAIKRVFQDVLEGKDTYGNPCMQPFYGAIRREPDRWQLWRPLMASNGRPVPAGK